MEVAVKGLILGVTISFLIGPIFFGLVDITISKGWKSGLAYIMAVIFTDVLFIVAINKLFSQLNFEDYKFYIGLVGGIILMFFGLITFFAKASLKSIDIEDIKTISGAFFKGVVINGLNPFVIIWWIGLYTSTSILGYTFSDKFIYYFCILLMVFLFDLLKMRFAYYLKTRLSIEKIGIVKKVAGVALFLFGIVMITKIAIL